MERTSKALLAVAGIILLAVSIPHVWIGTFGVPNWLAYPLLILFVVTGIGLLTGRKQFAYLGIVVILICFGISMAFIGPAGMSNPVLMLLSVGNITALVLIITALIRLRQRV